MLLFSTIDIISFYPLIKIDRSFNRVIWSNKCSLGIYLTVFLFSDVFYQITENIELMNHTSSFGYHGIELIESINSQLCSGIKD